MIQINEHIKKFFFYYQRIVNASTFTQEYKKKSN